MERNRKILMAILTIMSLSVAISLINITMKMGKVAEKSSITIPNSGPGVGIIRITGAITMSGSNDMFNQLGGAEAVVQMLNKYMNDDKIKAILIRIDSPGGTVGATQEIYNKIIDMRNSVVVKKPIVASMGDIAASGGYYCASACDYIFANNGTMTGSIGVIIAAPNFKDLFDKYGIKMTVIKSGKYKDILSSAKDVSEDDLILLQDLVDSSYKQFLKDVSRGRNLPIDDFKQYADGRIMTGQMALEYKLIDEIGGYEQALKKAKELAKLKPNAPVYYESSNPFQQFISSIQGMISKNPVKNIISNKSYSIVEYRYTR